MAAQEHTDIAALSAAALTAALSLLLTGDKYDVVGIGVTVSLILLIIGYAWSGRRTFTQSAAIASVVALSTIPGIGFVDEMSHAKDIWAALRSLKPDTADTNVPNWHMVVVWAAIFLGTLTIDAKRQRRAG